MLESSTASRMVKLEAEREVRASGAELVVFLKESGLSGLVQISISM